MSERVELVLTPLRRWQERRAAAREVQRQIAERRRSSSELLKAVHESIWQGLIPGDSRLNTEEVRNDQPR